MVINFLVHFPNLITETSPAEHLAGGNLPGASEDQKTAKIRLRRLMEQRHGLLSCEDQSHGARKVYPPVLVVKHGLLENARTK